MIPAAISGPTGTPRNRATPSTVPTSSPATRCGWEPIRETPRPPSHETNTPTAIASSDFQFIKEWISVDGGSVPLAMGAITPIVRMMIPTVMTVGIIILTIGVMAPIASGTLPPSTLIHSFMNWKSLLAIAVGVFVSWLGGRGVSLMGSQPHLVAGLLVGTVLGVALFRGVPVGPLIAAGIISLFIGKS